MSSPHPSVPCAARARPAPRSVAEPHEPRFPPPAAAGFCFTSIQHGLADDLGTISFTTMCVVVVGVNMRLSMEMHSWGPLEIGAMFITYLVLQISTIAYSFSSLPATGFLVSMSWDDYRGMIRRASLPRPPSPNLRARRVISEFLHDLFTVLLLEIPERERES